MNKVAAPLESFIRRRVPRRENFAIKGLVVLFLFGLFLFPLGISAQTGTSGQLTGNVTDSDGNYTFHNLSIGTYQVVVTKQGFKETSIANVVVNVSNITRQDAVLETG